MSQTVVGKLYMDGCGHCVTLEEPWNQMTKKVGKKVTVEEDIESAETGKLDELNKKYGTDVSVQAGYPTIYKIKKGVVEYYNGERTVQKLVSWALQKQGKSKKQKKIGGGKKTTNRKRSRRLQ
jgi:hypothetical protein